ncbi:hypothetical protein ACQEU3_38245 [Spirillospora sp. CA-253888]
MDPIVLAAGTAVVSAMATSGWQQASKGVAALWKRSRPDQADQVSAELEEVRSEVLEARGQGDDEAERALAGAWQSRFQRMLRTDPELIGDLERLLDEQLLPALDRDRRDRIRSIVQNATADRGSTVYQAGGSITVQGDQRR